VHDPGLRATVRARASTRGLHTGGHGLHGRRESVYARCLRRTGPVHAPTRSMPGRLADRRRASARSGATCDDSGSCIAESFVPEGTDCADDGNPCTRDACDAQGQCIARRGRGRDSLRPARTSARSGRRGDGSRVRASTRSFVPEGTECTDDGNPCTRDACDGQGPVHARWNPTPDVRPRSSTSKLQLIRDPSNPRRATLRILIPWRNPSRAARLRRTRRAGTSGVTCLYFDSSLVASYAVPGGADRWRDRPRARGWRYANRGAVDSSGSRASA
jgi:hypothetical protein